MAILSPARTERLLRMDFGIHPLTCDFSIALDATTRAIQHADLDISPTNALSDVVKKHVGRDLDVQGMTVAQKNACLASLVRDVANECGWLAGWTCLAQACPDSGMHNTLLEDVSLGVDVYNRVDVSDESRPLEDLQFSVVSSPQKDKLNETGLKTIGGSGWKKDSIYKDVVAKWLTPKDLIMGPCPLFGWMGQCKKVEILPDSSTAHYYWTAQLLGIVDYDMDNDESNIPGGIIYAIQRTARSATRVEGRMRGLGWNGLMTVDQQLFTRHKQIEWVKEGRGSRSLGPANISPADFAIACYADCAALAPFACHSETDLLQSRKSMFGAVLFANLHDLVFDIGYSSRISGAAYADATSVFQYDLPQAWLIGMMDSLASKILQGPPDQRALYGDNALCATAMWSIFNVRYRAWERLVKYTRLLQRSKSEKASEIIARAKVGMVLVPQDSDQDLRDAWTMVVDTSTAAELEPREAHVETYPVRPTYTLEPPTLCQKCAEPFHYAFHRYQDEVQAIHGLPRSITNSPASRIAVTIRRAAIWATTSECCDNCACAVGLWANDVSDKVIIAIMQSESDLSSRDWLLQNYFAGCVAFSPLRLVTITTGFDLITQVKYEAEAMGERDNVKT